MSNTQTALDDMHAAAGLIPWSSATRCTVFGHWLASVAPQHRLLPASLCIASADASFRRYLRITAADGASFIIMDAPPEHENCAPFVHVAQLMQQAGVRAPRVLAWDEANGFMLMTDLGRRTMLQAMNMEDAAANAPRYHQALHALLRWQRASRAGELPPYDAALLRRELGLFDEWYIGRHRGYSLDDTQRQELHALYALIITRCLAAPQVFVHRDYMPRNLMLPDDGAPELGVLDFQDAVYGPVTYDIASLMRDAFHSWDADFVQHITHAYWERARAAGLLDYENWARDFQPFWDAVQWMGLQRHLKVAGIFARLTLRDGKPKYLADAPRFITYIRSIAARWPELAPLLRLIDAVENSVLRH